jgi:hypothetical protein
MDSRQEKPRGARLRTATFVLTGALVGAVLAGPVAASAGNGYGPIWKHVKSKLAKAGTINAANNPVDWTRLKNVPAGLADGIDDVGGGAAALSFYTVQDSDSIDGGTGENSFYVLEDVEVLCDPGDTAISASPYFNVDLNGAAQGGADDMEVTIASIERVTQGDSQGYLAWAGNDSGSDRLLILEVLCLAQ